MVGGLAGWAGSFAAAGCRRRKSAGFNGYAFVANSEGQAVAAVDLTAFAVTRHIGLEANPSDLVVHPSKPVLYVLLPRVGILQEIDADQLQPRRKLRLSAVPSALRLSADGEALWILSAEQRQILQVDTGRMLVKTRTSLPAAPVDLDFPPPGPSDRGQIVVSLAGNGRISFVSQSTGKLENTVDVGGSLGGIRFRADGDYLVVADRGSRELVMWDLVGNRMAVRLPLAVRPDVLCPKPDGGELYVTGEGLDAVVSVYPFLTEVGTTLLAGRAPSFMATAGAYLLVANPKSNDVTIISTRNQSVVAVAPVGKEPCFIAVTPDDQFALVLNRESGDMSVLRIEALATRRPRSMAPAAPMFTMVPVGSRPVAAAVRSL